MSKLADKPLLWILLVGMTLTLPAAMGQRADENPSRDTIRAQLDAHRANVAESATVFFDRSLSDVKREQAVEDITVFLDVDDVQNAIRTARDSDESARIRVLALTRIQPHLDKEAAFIEDLFSWLADPSTPAKLRRSVADVLNGVMFSSFTMHAKHTEYLTVLGDLLRDSDEDLRRLAFSTLIVYGDDKAEQLLLQGLESPEQALLSPVESIRILGLNLEGDAFPVLHQVLLNPPDDDSRLEAVRLLGSYKLSRNTILDIVDDSDESVGIRLAALQTLSANAPDQFASYTMKLVADEDAAESLRTYAIQSEFQRRLAQRQQIKALEQPTDNFDAQILQLRESDSDAVRELAVEYSSVLLPNE